MEGKPHFLDAAGSDATILWELDQLALHLLQSKLILEMSHRLVRAKISHLLYLKKKYLDGDKVSASYHTIQLHYQLNSQMLMYYYSQSKQKLKR